MERGRRMHDWSRTCLLTAAVINSNPFRGKDKGVNPMDFMPSDLQGTAHEVSGDDQPIPMVLALGLFKARQ